MQVNREAVPAPESGSALIRSLVRALTYLSAGLLQGRGAAGHSFSGGAAQGAVWARGIKAPGAARCGAAAAGAATARRGRQQRDWGGRRRRQEGAITGSGGSGGAWGSRQPALCGAGSPKTLSWPGLALLPWRPSKLRAGRHAGGGARLAAGSLPSHDALRPTSAVGGTLFPECRCPLGPASDGTGPQAPLFHLACTASSGCASSACC